MPQVLSKFDTLPFNCYEVSHTWSPYCTEAAYMVGKDAFKEGFKIYATMFALSSLVTRRIPKSPKDIWKAFVDVCRSSAFLSTNAFGYFVFYCLLRRLKGNMNFFTIGFVPALMACYCAILVEKERRRPLLALYVANVASDAVFRMLRHRGYVSNIKHFDVFLFASSCIAFIYQMKKGNRRNDLIDSVFTKVLGKEEFPERSREPRQVHASTSEPTISASMENDNDDARNEGQINRGRTLHGDPYRVVRMGNESYRTTFIRFVLWMHRSVEDIACHLERMVISVYEDGRHEKCPHKNPCFQYWMQGFTTRFAAGCGLQVALESFGFLTRLLKGKGGTNKTSILLSCFRRGLGFSAICLAFRVFSCSFRWLKDTNTPCDAAFSSILASLLGFFLLRPPPSIGMYMFFKAAETVIADSHRQNNWKIIRWLDKVYGGGWCALYAVSTAILFHVGTIEPHNLKPSYWKFLNRVAGGKLYQINRPIFSVYGLGYDATKFAAPNLDPRFLSDAMRKVLELKAKMGVGGNVIKDAILQVLSGH